MTPPINASNAEVAILEARMDGRISSMEATFNSFVKLMEERHKAAEERHQASEARMDRMEAMLTEIRAEIRNLRTTIVVTAISSVLAAVLGISAINASLYANMRATFETGKDAAAAQAQIIRLAEETIALAKKMEAEKKK